MLVGAEQGLLGIAFHPDFATQRPPVPALVATRSGDTRVAEFRTATARSPEPLRELLHVDQPEENHNGGQLAFGPDGRLYLGLGDGGGAFDPRQHRAGPDEQLLGKLLAGRRRRAAPRLAASCSPACATRGASAFDPALGEVWIGDVGQDEVEEIDRVLLELDEPPKNLGWSAFEGTTRDRRPRPRPTSGELVWPVADLHARRRAAR